MMSLIRAWQVVGGHLLPNRGSGWAAIGASVQANHVYTLAQFDNFAVVAESIQCPAPAHGNGVSIVWCGGVCARIAFASDMGCSERRQLAVALWQWPAASSSQSVALPDRYG